MSFSLKRSRGRFCVVAALMPLLAGCSYTLNQNATMANVVQAVPLNNGKTLYVGYKLPDAAASCQLVNQTKRNWSLAQTEGQIKLGGGRQVLKDAAVASVEQRPQAGINYVALIIPNETDLGTINLTMARDATTSYFRCVNPPQPG